MVFEAIAELVAERVEKDVSEITMDRTWASTPWTPWSC